MIAYAAIVPHSPLLVPTIGQEKRAPLALTGEAMEHIARALVKHRVETILIMSSHMEAPAGGVYLNMAESYELNFAPFGEFATSMKLPPDWELAAQLRAATLEGRGPVGVMTSTLLDVGCTTPLFVLLKALPQARLLPMGSTLASPREAYTIGEQISDTLRRSPSRVAVIASANLSHRLHAEAPAGYSPRASGFDEKILDALETNDQETILNLTPELITDVAACGVSPIAFLFGALKSVDYQSTLLRYEGPFGIGHVVVSLVPQAL